jgi:hypothetical protein
MSWAIPANAIISARAEKSAAILVTLLRKAIKDWPKCFPAEAFSAFFRAPATLA